MKRIIVLLLLPVFAQASHFKCGTYRITGEMTNGKTKTLLVKEREENPHTFFFDGSCPEIPDGIVKGNFQLISTSPDTLSCLDKEYKVVKAKHHLKLTKKAKCKA